MAEISSPLRACPKCGFEQERELPECLVCGVIFSRLEATDSQGRQRTYHPAENRTKRSRTRTNPLGQGIVGRVWEGALSLPDTVNPFELGARAVVCLGLLILSWSFVFAEIERSQMSPTLVHFILSRVNLVFHEAGHIIFIPLGNFMTVLGGSLLQVLIPMICSGAFLGRHLNPFGAAVCVWWTGQSLIGLAPYINDARAQRLVLLGGVTGRDRPGYHDWNNILGQLGWLRHDHTLARLVQMWGTILILLALAWAAYLVHAQYKIHNRSRG